MQRVKRSTAVPALPAPPAGGAPGFFTGGDPQTAVPATVPGYEWFNGIQEELAYVIEQAGLVMSSADNTQIHAAILKMIQDAGKAVVIQNATFEASVADGEAVRWDAGNSRFDEAIADGSANNQAVGFADVTNSKVYCYGETPALFAGLTPGARYYLDATTAGAITAAAPTDVVVVGVAKSATTLFVDVDHEATGSSASIVAHKNANYAIAQADNGKTLVADAALDYTLPLISGLTLPFEVTVKLGAVTGTSMGAACSGTDKIVAAGAELASTKTNVRGCFMKLVADSTGKWQAIYKWEFRSSQLTLTANTIISAAHNLGTTPYDMQLVGVCLSDQFGYASSDLTLLFGGAPGVTPVRPYADGANIGAAIPEEIRVNLRSGGTVGSPYTVTLANWRAVLTAKL